MKRTRTTRQEVFTRLLRVPKGKAVSYGELARATGTSARAVGAIMRSNSQPHFYPCYKVVHKDCRVGNYSGDGGVKAKIKLLKKDGVVIRDGRIGLRFLHRF